MLRTQKIAHLPAITCQISIASQVATLVPEQQETSIGPIQYAQNTEDCASSSHHMPDLYNLASGNLGPRIKVQGRPAIQKLREDAGGPKGIPYLSLEHLDDHGTAVTRVRLKRLNRQSASLCQGSAFAGLCWTASGN